jgi:hypothetical protein
LTSVFIDEKQGLLSESVRYLSKNKEGFPRERVSRRAERD